MRDHSFLHRGWLPTGGSTVHKNMLLRCVFNLYILRILSNKNGGFDSSLYSTKVIIYSNYLFLNNK